MWQSRRQKGREVGSVVWFPGAVSALGKGATRVSVFWLHADSGRLAGVYIKGRRLGGRLVTGGRAGGHAQDCLALNLTPLLSHYIHWASVRTVA